MPFAIFCLLLLGQAACAAQVGCESSKDEHSLLQLKANVDKQRNSRLSDVVHVDPPPRKQDPGYRVVEGLVQSVAGKDTDLLDSHGKDYGWYDPHLHETGGINFHGTLLLVADDDTKKDFVTQMMDVLPTTGSADAPADAAHFSAIWNQQLPALYSVLARHDILESLADGGGAFQKKILVVGNKIREKLYENGRKMILQKAGFSGPSSDEPGISAVIGRASPGSGTLFPLMKCLNSIHRRNVLTRDEECDEECEMRNVLTRLLSASPLLDFSSSYAMRGLIEPPDMTMFHRLVVQELMDDNIVYTQMSTPTDKVPEFTAAYQAGEAGGLLAGIAATFTGKYAFKNAQIYSGERRAKRVHLGWMPLIPGTMFACDEHFKVTKQRDGTTDGNYEGPSANGCDETKWNKHLKAFKNKIKQSEVDGVDFASKEIYVINHALGFERLKDVVDALEAVARTKTVHIHVPAPASQERESIDVSKKKQMMMHMHMGEGFPIFDKDTIYKNSEGTTKAQLPGLQARCLDGSEPARNCADGKKPLDLIIPGAFDKDNGNCFGMDCDYWKDFCEEAKSNKLFSSFSLPVLRRTEGCDKKRYPDEAANEETRCYPNEPQHYETARKNIDTLLDNIERIQETKCCVSAGGKGGADDASSPSKHEHIKYQMGHATHVTLKQAIRMKALGVAADIDLSSNFATGALNWEVNDGARAGSSVLFVKDGSENIRAHKSDKDLITKKAEVAEAHVRHSVLKMLLAGVDVTIGTDGIGIEHSGHLQDYGVVKAMVRFYNKFDETEKDFNAYKSGLTSEDEEGADDAADHLTDHLTDEEAWQEFKNLKSISKKLGLKDPLDAEEILRNQRRQYEFMEAR